MKLHSKSHVLFCTLAAVVMLSVQGSSQKKSEGRIDPQNLQVLGFVLGKNEVSDVERKLGKARESSATGHDFTQHCYQSTGTEHTVLVFEDWSGTLSGFTIYESHKGVRLCTKTSLIMRGISTASGLKLGISREHVLRILGKPSRTRGNTLVYVSDYNRPGTVEEVAKFRAAYPREGALDVRSYTEIKLSFSRSRLTSIYVSHTDTT